MAKESLKKFLVVGTDGMYTEVSEDTGESPEAIRDKFLATLAKGDRYGNDFTPTRYTIYAVVGEPLEVDDDTVEEAIDQGIKVQAKRIYEARREEQDRADLAAYERVKAKLGK